MAVGATAGEKFGWAVSISDQKTIVVGAPEFSTSTGKVYVFTYSGTSWTSAYSLGTGPAFNAQYGWSVAISGSGTTIAVGALGVSSNSGAVYLHTLNTGTSTWSGPITLATGASLDKFGKLHL